MAVNEGSCTDDFLEAIEEANRGEVELQLREGTEALYESSILMEKLEFSSNAGGETSFIVRQRLNANNGQVPPKSLSASLELLVLGSTYTIFTRFQRRSARSEPLVSSIHDTLKMVGGGLQVPKRKAMCHFTR